MRRITADEVLSYDAFVCDMDGVIYRGREVLWENVSVLLKLQAMGKVVRFLTNNSTRTPEYYAERLKGMGFEVSPEDVMSSSVATGRYLTDEGIGRAYIVGSRALREVLSRYGVRFSTGRPEAVVVGLDPNFTYAKLRKAASLVYMGVKFVATNPDTSLPVENGVLPGAGSLVAAISSASGREPDVVVGKPNPTIFRMAISDLKGKRVLFIGDRLNTDILGGKRAGLSTLLVLTGVHGLEDVKRYGVEPDYYAESLSSVLPVSAL